MMDKIIDVVLPRFAANNAHWRMLALVLKQNYKSFNVVIGANPCDVDEIINFINEYRYSHECVGLNKVLIITDKEELEGEEYLEALKKSGEEEAAIVLTKEYIFFSDSSLAELVLDNRDILSDYNALQGKIEQYVLKNRPRNLASLIFVSDKLKEIIFKIRDKIFKLTRFENILNSMVISAFLMVAAVFVGREFENAAVFVDILVVLSFAALAAALVRTILHIFIKIFDKQLENHRRRKENK